jgi:alkylation response protein AidB-like acyl-CoA dehydrogenase
MQLEAASLMTLKAAALYDAGEPCGIEANDAKYAAAEAAHEACETAVLTLGGMGYAAEYHVERYLRESYIPRIAPINRREGARPAALLLILSTTGTGEKPPENNSKPSRP